MRVTVSRFFRDPEVWRGLTSEVLPGLLESVPPGQRLRAWSAGCCGGEEPYTLAVLWDSLPEPVRRDRELEVLATDVDEAVLERARAARYPPAAISPLPSELRASGFVRDGDRVRPVTAVRARVRFAHADLLAERPPRNRHLVLCRYLAFTYYRGARLERAVERLTRAMAHDGALVTGRKESLQPEGSARLKPWPGAPCAFRRVR
jgi:chemotaxis methyl-accepting protein methylase